MEHLQQTFTVRFEYKVYFTSSLFDEHNKLLLDFLTDNASGQTKRKILFVVDKNVIDATSGLKEQIKKYFNRPGNIELISQILIVPGGETVKNDETYLNQVLLAVNTYGIDRHSYIAAIGGGAVLDMVGYAAAVAHRGIKHIRIPTTVLSQNDSGIGVKNGINYFSKKNFLGTFAPPAAVFNDDRFLLTLSDRDWRSGISEAIKVALIKDKELFNWLEANAGILMQRDAVAMNYLIWHCARLHLTHIAGADPFETGSSRPLDFGHWSAHKLEYLSNFEVKHGEAVALGIALDTVYSNLSGLLLKQDMDRIINLLQCFGFDITHPLLQVTGINSPLITGLQEFREHLGGCLTIMLLKNIGEGVEVHDMDTELLTKATNILAGLQHMQIPN